MEAKKCCVPGCCGKESNPNILRKRSHLDMLPIVYINADSCIVSTPKPASSTEKVSNTQRITRSKTLSSPADKKTKLDEECCSDSDKEKGKRDEDKRKKDKREKDKLDSEYEENDEDDYEVEYLDSEKEITDSEEKPFQEIEYLDMNQLELEDNQQITTTNIIKIKDVSEANKTIFLEIIKRPTAAKKTFDLETYKKRVSDMNENHALLAFKPRVSVANKSHALEANKILTIEANKRRDWDMNEKHALLAFKPRGSVANTSHALEANKILTIEANKKRDSDMNEKHALLAFKPRGSVATTTHALEVNKRYELNKNLPQQPNETQKLASACMPIHEVDPSNESIDQPMQKDNQPMQDINQPIQNDNQPMEIVNQPSELNQNSKSMTPPMKCNTLEEFMSKHKLKPIDTKTPLHEQLSVTVAQLQKEHNVKLPIEITDAYIEKVLAASISQNAVDGNKTLQRNVYVIDSTGAVILMEQLGPPSTLQAPKLSSSLHKINNNSAQKIKKAKRDSPAQTSTVKKYDIHRVMENIDVGLVVEAVTEEMNNNPAQKTEIEKRVPVQTSTVNKKYDIHRVMENIDVGLEVEAVTEVPGETPSTPIQHKPETLENEYKLFTVQSQRERTLTRELRDAKKELKKLKLLKDRLKLRVKQSRDLLTNTKFKKISDRMPRIARMITTIQLREGVKSSNGRRFTEEEKVVAHSLLEHCPSAYKYMRRMGFILPDTRILRSASSNLQADIESAVNGNEAILKIKNKVEKMTVEQRFCTLLFDEKLISPENRRSQQVVTTFGNEGDQTEVTFEADHVLIFMVKGILEYYQEPVSFTFSFGATNGTDLALQIKTIISNLQTIGYIVLATVCDHADNNRAAIEILTNEARCDEFVTENKTAQQIFQVNNEQIIALYDPPHLLKGVRNNLISKDLIFAMEKHIKTAKWKHLEMMLGENPEYNGMRLIPKLTENQVYPTKLGISKTKYACQIFSQTIAMYMRYLADKDILPPQSRDTADLLLFFDELFDSVNNHHNNTYKVCRPLASVVTPNSQHKNKWTEAIKVLQRMKFVNNGAVVPVSDFDCWIWTLEGYRLLLDKLFNEYKVSTVSMRNVNQDSLETLFRTEVNPTPKVKKAKRMKESTPSRPQEVVTQKVIKAINRINRQVKVE